ncbi:aminoacyl-tRNA hydrolase [Cerasibacillus terrae]|uniref:Peptidyl-tRNA hydrolase n=1 Tax=Cerasibacillus terrae TaxID=2498845 RepID=A0A5C8NRJ5_9BACI|nr:aminoacyl-tRNA hydrolase [Cerasibacillus terrae]TXL63445.1 aminoacyl-tRNA hydrolase [Cerasibacillus terrae]
MKCIVGLGNPGKKYDKTRHNIGFMVIDEILQSNQWDLDKEKFQGEYTISRVNGEKLILLKPQTFMNLSGESVRPILDYYDIPPENLLVIFDDLDLPTGKIRLRQKGGHGGHNGIRSIIDQLGTKDFKRLRIGVGRPETNMSIVNYVLSTFAKKEQEAVHKSIRQAAEASLTWLEKPFSEVMNEWNK